MVNFLETLAAARKKAQLSGQPLTSQETQGMQEGYFNGQAQLSNAKRAESVKEKQAQDQLALENKMTQEQIDAAKKSGTNQIIGNVANTGGTLLAMDAMKSKPGESLISQGYNGVKSLFSPQQTNFAEQTSANVSGNATLIAPETVEVMPAMTETGVSGSGSLVPAAETAGAAPEGGSLSLGGLGYGVGIAAAASAARSGLSQVLSNQSSPWLKKQGEYMKEPTFEGLATKATGHVFGQEKMFEDLSPVLDPTGSLLKKVGCIIVTVCTDRNSPEVNLTREYRDKFLDGDSLRGYYCIAEKIVPFLVQHEKVRKDVKKWLVDRLIDYGEYRLGKKKERPKVLSVIISKAFLATIKIVGCLIPKFVRQNGEVY